MTDQTRAAFEAHFQLTQRQAWQHKDGSYQFPEIQAKWEGWQAGQAAEPVSTTPVAWMTEDGRVCTTRTKEAVMHQRTSESYCIPLYAAPVAAAAPGADDALLRFYNVSSSQELIAAQEKHIAKLQAKLADRTPATPFTNNVREG